MQNAPVITIDGPGGSGKGTLCKLVASALGWHILDSGALYRVLGLAAQQHSIGYDDKASLEVMAANLDVQFIPRNNRICVILEGMDVSDAIRTEEAGMAASQVATHQEVRTALLDRQRAFRQWPGLVTDGRDMGTVIFPEAQLKIYLKASQEERAERRYKQLKEQGNSVKIDKILSEIAARDERDMSRKASPLKPAADAYILDTTGMSITEVYDEIFAEVEKRGLAAKKSSLSVA